MADFDYKRERQLYQPGWDWQVFLVDVGEIEIERPKKNQNATTLVSRNVTLLSRNCWSNLRPESSLLLHQLRKGKRTTSFRGAIATLRKRFGLCLNLIAGLLNYELAQAH